MRKRKVLFVNEAEHRASLDAGYLMMYRPMGSRLFRIYVPEAFCSNPDLQVVLHAYCAGRVHRGVFYVKATDMEMVEYLGETLFSMGIMEFVIVSPDEKYFQTDPSQLNCN